MVKLKLRKVYHCAEDLRHDYTFYAIVVCLRTVAQYMGLEFIECEQAVEADVATEQCGARRGREEVEEVAV